MIIFRTIRFKNFLSYGNKFVEFDLTSNKTTLFSGDSGSGKSTLLCAITFALFGRAFRNIKKNNLINSINGSGAIVELEFSKGNKNFKIIRGIKPNKFEIYENDQLIDQNASVIDYQFYLENQILKFNFKSFTQICVLGAANFVPFMQLTASDRRNVIEEILDIRVFSLMNEILKQDLLTLTDGLQKLNNEISLVKSEIKIHSQYKDKSESATNKKKISLNKELKKLEELITKTNSALDYSVKSKKETEAELKKIKDVQYNLDKLKLSKVAEFEHEKSFWNKKLKFLEDNNNCESCLQGITHEHKDFIKIKTEDLIFEKEKQLNKIVHDINIKVNKIEDSPKVKSLADKVISIQKQIDVLTDDLRMKSIKRDMFRQELNDLDKIKSVNYESELINQKSLSLDMLLDKQKILAEEQHICELASKLLKDDGIKTDIIKEFLPLINNFINDYLQKMNFFVTFTLDENFNESIKARGRDDFEYSCFSEGEKQRLDLAMLFTWRSISQLKNSVNTNLLILDEICDSALNIEATENVIELLRSEEFGNNNIFVISHKTTIADKFEKVYEFKKTNNFSVITTN